MTVIDAIIKLRRGTASAWATANPVLNAGETGFETDTSREKVGDGVTGWNSLPYMDTAAHIHDSSTVGRALLTAANAAAAKTALSLDLVNNTSDTGKPVSTAQAAADAVVLATATGLAVGFAIAFGNNGG